MPRPIEYFRRIGVELLPVQAFILKLIYGERLDGTFTSIVAQEGRLTEVGYLSFLQAQGRTNIGKPNPEGYSMVSLSMERRSGKSYLLSLVNAYEVYLAESRGATSFSAVNWHPNQSQALDQAQGFRRLVARNHVITRETRQDITLSDTYTFHFKSGEDQDRFQRGRRFDLATMDETNSLVEPRISGARTLVLSQSNGLTLKAYPEHKVKSRFEIMEEF